MAGENGMSNSRGIYTFHDVRIEVSGLCEESHDCLKTMGLSVVNTLSVDGRIFLKKTKNEFEIFEEGIRTHYNDNRKTSEYELGAQKLFMCPGYALCFDSENVKVELTFRSFDEKVADVLESAFRWLLKLNSAKQGVQYLPGSLVEFKSKGILIAGHPELGALDVLAEFCKQGGKFLSQGVLCDGKSWRSMPGAHEAKPLFSAPSENTGDSLEEIIFVNRWLSDESVLRPMKSKQALEFLWHVNRRSYEYLWPCKHFPEYVAVYRTQLQTLEAKQLLLGRRSFFRQLENLF
jgi:hypothetical protein